MADDDSAKDDDRDGDTVADDVDVVADGITVASDGASQAGATAVQARIQLPRPQSGAAASTTEDFPPPAIACCDHHDHRDHYLIIKIMEAGMVIIESVMVIMIAVKIGSSSKPRY